MGLSLRSWSWNVSGFPPPTNERAATATECSGGFGLATCSSATAWSSSLGVGALKVNGGMYIDDEPVWGLTGRHSSLPARFAVEPLVVLDPARGVPGTEAAKALTCLKWRPVGGATPSDRGWIAQSVATVWQQPYRPMRPMRRRNQTKRTISTPTDTSGAERTFLDHHMPLVVSTHVSPVRHERGP